MQIHCATHEIPNMTFLWLIWVAAAPLRITALSLLESALLIDRIEIPSHSIGLILTALNIKLDFSSLDPHAVIQPKSKSHARWFLIPFLKSFFFSYDLFSFEMSKKANWFNYTCAPGWKYWHLLCLFTREANYNWPVRVKSHFSSHSNCYMAASWWYRSAYRNVRYWMIFHIITVSNKFQFHSIFISSIMTTNI
jgi:hypothetical protein